MKTKSTTCILVIVYSLLVSCNNNAESHINDLDDNDYFFSESNMITYANSILYPNLYHAYRADMDVHDYSGNWDFDGDGEKDWLFIAGNGGAHLRYHPIIILRNKYCANDFSFLSLHPPIFIEAKILMSYTHETSKVKFSVHDFNNDGKDDIYFLIDPTWDRDMNFPSDKIILSYDAEIGDFKIYAFKNFMKRSEMQWRK